MLTDCKVSCGKQLQRTYVGKLSPRCRNAERVFLDLLRLSLCNPMMLTSFTGDAARHDNVRVPSGAPGGSRTVWPV